MNKSCVNQILNKPIECEFSCLIEREDAMSKVQTFFDMLAEKERGILRVVGNYGTGRTRFLSEIAQKASEYGFELGDINAEGKSELLDKISGQVIIDYENVDKRNFEKDIIKHINGSNKKGLVLIIDNALSMSDEDLSFVRKFLNSKSSVKLGLVYSIEPDTVFSLDYVDVDLCETVCINPLSPKGTQMWIKNTLAWDEAPTSFLKWLYRETKGLPKLLQENINCLLKNGFLIYNPDNNWTVVGDFSDVAKNSETDRQNEINNDKTTDVQNGSFINELKLSNGMSHIWNTWQYWNESLTRIKEIIKKREAIPNLENVKLYIWFGRLINVDSDHEKAISVLNDGLELFKQTSDKEGEAEILYMKALALSTLDDLRKVAVVLQESLSAYRLMNDKAGVTRAIQYLSLIYYYQGEYDKAEMFSVESLELCRKLKDRPGICRSLMRLGMIARGKGDLVRALKLFYEYIKKSDELDDKKSVSIALLNIAEISISKEAYTYARNFYDKSLNLLLEMGYKMLIAHTLKDLAEITKYEGDYDKANELFYESLDMMEQCGNNTEIMWLCRSMAELELKRQNYSKAKEMYRKGLNIFKESSKTNWLYPMSVFEALAEISFAQDELTRAAKLIGAADKLFEVSGKLISKNDFAQFYTRHWKVQEKMNRDTFEAAWSEGNMMRIEEALEFAMEDAGNKADNDMADKMISYIKANFSNDISLTDIAEYFNMSPCYLSTMFKYYTGENFKDYLNFYRVKKAKEYLQNGNMKMGTVAKLVGCNSINTFIRIFKKYEGVSPGQYVSKK